MIFINERARTQVSIKKGIFPGHFWYIIQISSVFTQILSVFHALFHKFRVILHGEKLCNFYNITAATELYTREAVTTAVENVEAVKVNKVIENGMLIIEKNGVRYNALGQKL